MRVLPGVGSLRLLCFAGLLSSAGCGSVPDDKPDGGPDGPAMTDPGAFLWARSMSTLSVTGVVESAGGLSVAGYLTAPADLGGGSAIIPNGLDSVVAGFVVNDAGFLYATRFGAAGEEFGFLDSVDSAATPILHGVSYGDVDLGRGPVTGGGGTGADGFIGRYSPSGPSWVQRLVGPGEDKLVDTALASGGLYVAGWFETSSRLDTLPLSSVGGRDIVLTKMNSFTGQLDFVRSYGSVDRDEASSIVAAGGTLVAAGFFAGTLALGGGAAPITSNGAALDVWVARLSLTGDGVWAVKYGGTGEDRAGQIATDAAGDLYLTGTFTNQIGFGAVNLVSRGGTDLFVVKLRGADGSVAWATSFGSAGADSGGAISVDDAGHVLVGATILGPLEDGGKHAGGLDAYIASYDAANGNRRWDKVLGSAADDRGGPVRGGQGAVYAALSAGAPLPSLGVPITGAASYVGLLLKIVP